MFVTLLFFEFFEKNMLCSLIKVLFTEQAENFGCYDALWIIAPKSKHLTLPRIHWPVSKISILLQMFSKSLSRRRVSSLEFLLFSPGSWHFVRNNITDLLGNWYWNKQTYVLLNRVLTICQLKAKVKNLDECDRHRLEPTQHQWHCTSEYAVEIQWEEDMHYLSS